jgi:hypothetical protein
MGPGNNISRNAYPNKRRACKRNGSQHPMQRNLGRRKIQTWEDEENARGKEQSSKLAED